MRLASRLHMSLQRVQCETTANEFYKWMWFFQEEDERLEKIDWQTATLAAEIRRSWVKHPEKVKVTDFLPKHKLPKSKPLTKKQRTEVAKSRWAALLGSPTPKD